VPHELGAVFQDFGPPGRLDHMRQLAAKEAQ
jgi:hypothetical protein